MKRCLKGLTAFSAEDARMVPLKLPETFSCFFKYPSLPGRRLEGKGSFRRERNARGAPRVSLAPKTLFPISFQTPATQTKNTQETGSPLYWGTTSIACVSASLHLRCFPLGWSGSGSVIRDHSDHGRSKEPMNPCPEWIHWFIWSTMILSVISDHWSWSRSSQRNAPLSLVFTSA